MAEIYGSFSPDAHGTGLVEGPLDPLRYNGQSDDPREVPGILRALMPERVRLLDVGCGTGSPTEAREIKYWPSSPTRSAVPSPATVESKF